MGEHTTQQQNVPGSKTAPLSPDDSPDGTPATPERTSPSTGRRSGGPHQPGLRVLRRAFPTLRSRPTGSLSVQYHGRPRHVVISALLLTVVLTVIMTVPLLPGQVQIEPGVPATQDIFSPTFLRYESKVLTEKARQEASDDPANQVWVQDTSIVQRQRALLQSNLSAVDAMRVNSTMDSPPIGGREPVLQGITVTQKLLDMLVTLPDNDYKFWRDSNVLIAYDAMMRDRRL